MLDDAAIGQAPQVVHVDHPIVHAVAAGAEQAGHHVLRGALGAARAGNGAELARGLDLVGEGRIHRGLDTLPDILGNHALLLLAAARPMSPFERDRCVFVMPVMLYC